MLTLNVLSLKITEPGNARWLPNACRQHLSERQGELPWRSWDLVQLRIIRDQVGKSGSTGGCNMARCVSIDLVFSCHLFHDSIYLCLDSARLRASASSECIWRRCLAKRGLDARLLSLNGSLIRSYSSA